MKMPKLTPATARAAMLATFVALTLIIFAIMVWVPSLTENDLFKTLAQAIVITGLIGMAGGFWFTDTDRNPPSDPPEN